MPQKNLYLEEILHHIPLSVLEEEESIIFVLDRSFNILFCNPAWDEFFKANGGQGPYSSDSVLGTSIFDVTPKILEPFYYSLFHEARISKDPVEHQYECSSPTEYRLMRMRILPLSRGFIVVNEYLITKRRNMKSFDDIDEAAFKDRGNNVTMCSHCRRARRNDGRWKYVPRFVAMPPRKIKHRLCDLCHTYHYPNFADSSVTLG